MPLVTLDEVKWHCRRRPTVPTEAGLTTNPVFALDLAFFLPLCAVAGIGLLRRTGAAAYGQPMLIWVALMGAGVVGGFLFSAIAGEDVPVIVAAVISALSLASAGLAAVPILGAAPGSLLIDRRARAG